MKLTAENKTQILSLKPTYNDYFEGDDGIRVARSANKIEVSRHYNVDKPDESWSIGGMITVNDWDSIDAPFDAMLNEINLYESSLMKTYKTLENPRLFNWKFIALIGCSLK